MLSLSKCCHHLACAGTLAVLMGASGMVAAQNYDASLERGARADTTAEQRYQTAIREAGGGLKVAMAECRTMPASERKACASEAQSNYKKDMALAREMKKNPDARPFSVKGGEVRMTGETPIKP